MARRQVECTPLSPVERVTVFPNSAEVTRRIDFGGAASDGHTAGDGAAATGADVEGAAARPAGARCPSSGFIDVVVRDVPYLLNTSSLRVHGAGSNVTILGVTMRTPRYLSDAARGRKCGPTRSEAREADPTLAALVKQDKEAHAKEVELGDEAARVQNEVKALDAAQRSATTDAQVLGALLNVPTSTSTRQAGAGGEAAACKDGGSCSAATAGPAPSATHLLDLLTALSARRAALDRDYRLAKAGKEAVLKQRAALARRIAVEKTRVDSEWERQNDARRCNPESMEDRVHAHADVVVSVEVGQAAQASARRRAIDSLSVTYLVGDARWLPSYEVRFDTAKSEMELVYYGNVAQDSGEDWEGALLQLSTSDPNTREGPPSLPTRHVRWGHHGFGSGEVISQSGGSSRKERKSASMYNTMNMAPQAAGAASRMHQRKLQQNQYQHQQNERQFGAMPDMVSASLSTGAAAVSSGFPGAPGGLGDEDDEEEGAEDTMRAFDAVVGEAGAAWAMPTMVGGGGHGSPALFQVKRKATIASTGRAHKLTLSRLHMPSTLTHIVRPAVSRHAFVRATTVNSGSMPLLPSHDVGVFVDGSFVADSHLAFVNPGERFKTWLGEDPAVRVQHVAPRSQHAKSGLFTEAHHQTYKTVTTITNMRGAAQQEGTAQGKGKGKAKAKAAGRSINLIVAQQLPRSTDESIKVHMSSPSAAEVRALTPQSRAERHTEDAAGAGINVEAATAGGGEPTATEAEKDAGGAAFAPGIWVDADSSTVEWRRVVPAGDSVVLPFEYSIEWPSGKQDLIID